MDNEVKIVLLGETGVGKSSLAMRFTSGAFDEDSPSTIGASFMTRSAHVRGNLILTRQEAKEDDPETHYVKFSIFDTAGQEKYHSLTPMYYRSADAAIIVFDVARRESLASVDFWSRELASRGPEDLTVVVVANKIDHVDGRTIDEGEARAAFSRHVASRFPEAVYVEASARSGAGVDTVFGSAARALGVTGSSVPRDTESVPTVVGVVVDPVDPAESEASSFSWTGEGGPLRSTRPWSTSVCSTTGGTSESSSPSVGCQLESSSEASESAPPSAPPCSDRTKAAYRRRRTSFNTEDEGDAIFI